MTRFAASRPAPVSPDPGYYPEESDSGDASIASEHGAISALPLSFPFAACAGESGVTAWLEPEHIARRPSWDCRVCDQQWPCAGAQAELAEQYADQPTALMVYLAANLYEAIEDMRAVPQGSPKRLATRFLDWASPRRWPTI